MQRFRSSSLATAIATACVVFLGQPPSCRSQTQVVKSGSEKIVSFILYDVNIEGSKRDADRVRDLVISGIRAVNKRGILRHAPMPFQTLIDENLTREKLRSMLTELDDHVDQQTTVFFYYKGHGGYSTQPPGSARITPCFYRVWTGQSSRLHAKNC